jgi:hypothetical protein
MSTTSNLTLHTSDANTTIVVAVYYSFYINSTRINTLQMLRGTKLSKRRAQTTVSTVHNKNHWKIAQIKIVLFLTICQ